MSWSTTGSRVVYENPWIRVQEDSVVRPDGTDGIYGVLEVRRPAVFVVALTEEDELILVSVDRHTVGLSLEVPAGGTDGEDPLEAARRELAEETGLAAEHWQQVGAMNALNGICRAPEVVFLATGLSPLQRDDEAARAEEGIREVRRTPVAEVLELVRTGGIDDGETVAALMFALLALGRVR